jgi:hypothetical protein
VDAFANNEPVQEANIIETVSSFSLDQSSIIGKDLTMNTDRIYYSRDAEIQANRDKTLMALVLMAVGLGIGAALALLFAPAAGSETREEIAHTFEEGVKEGRETVEPLMKRLEHEIADLSQRFQDRIKQ